LITLLWKWSAPAKIFMNKTTEKAYIGLGSNIGDRGKNLSAAIEMLKNTDGVTVTAVSHVYETTPVGYILQPDFFNCAVEVETYLEPYALLDACQKIENSLGRVRTIRWGPRTVDLDILFFGGLVINEERLSIPHPEASKRGFVLTPLMDIAPDLLHPVLKTTVRELYGDYLKEQGDEEIKRVRP
jgi:2-amino-4-hydroxy-6-hydroxymethyldihydropteridine diphosphokinase